MAAVVSNLSYQLDLNTNNNNNGSSSTFKAIHSTVQKKLKLNVGIGGILFVQVWLILLVFLTGPGSDGFPVTLNLERSVPLDTKLDDLRVRDRAYHRKIFHTSTTITPITVLPVEGDGDLNSTGIFYTKVRLGTPPQEFHVQIDTGSDVLWVNCNSCVGCSTSSLLGITPQFFNPDASTSAKKIPCSDRVCRAAAPNVEDGCVSDDSFCRYHLTYEDGSEASGHYFSDNIYLNKYWGNFMTPNSVAPIVFGCSNNLSGRIAQTGIVVDGILGLSQHQLSIVSQLALRHDAPRIFSHCLSGKGNGASKLVLGEIVEPGMVYTPLVAGKTVFFVNMQSIAVNGKIVPIDTNVFASSRDRGAAVDSGTTLVVLAEEAYDPFVNAITAELSSVQSLTYQGFQCFSGISSVVELFPPISFNFEGGASLTVRAQDYLRPIDTLGYDAIWCLGFVKGQGQHRGITILGDLVLRDKIFVYDLSRQRLGWVNYDCSQPINVSLTSAKDTLNSAGQPRMLYPIVVALLLLLLT